MAKPVQSEAGAEDQTVPVSIRFPQKELRRIQRVARRGGESASNWIRRHALAALHEQAAA